MKITVMLLLLFASTSPCFATDVVVTNEASKSSVIVEVNDSHLSQQVSYKWGTDPFYRTPGFVKGTPKEPTFVLKGILHSNDDDSSAIINKKTVYVNSIIDGYAVREIGDNYVIVQKGETLKELQLAPIQNRSTSEINIYDRLPAMESEAKVDQDAEVKK